jgi:capsular polysaccharide biosynthesis protein
MRTEHEPPRTLAEPLPDLEAEREIDFGRLGRRIATRWWLVAAAIALGGIIGYLTSLGGGDTYVARTTIYLGQPLSPTGNVQIQSLGTNPSTVTQIVRSDQVVQAAAGAIDVPPGELRRGISTRTLSTTDAARRTPANVNPLVEISVRGPWRGRTAEAANLLAAAVVEEVSGYVDEKVRQFDQRLDALNRELASIDRRIAELERGITQPGLSSVERLTLLTLMGLQEQRRGIVSEERTDTEQLLTLAEEVERSRQIGEPRAAKVPAQSPRSAIIVGALIGLLAGLALALVWEPLLGRRRVRPA